jgi:putative ABC transport system substrate-binding protein
VRRREFISLLGGAAAWPLTARAQQPERVKRIGVLMNFEAGEPQGQARVEAFHRALLQLGWSVGQNVHIDYRWGAGDPERYRKYAVELNALAPDVILATNTPTAVILQQTSQTVPLVFVQVPDPVRLGFVASLARPGRNATGFINFPFAMSAKWLELLKQIAPSVTRAAILWDSTDPGGVGQWGALKSAAPLLGVELSQVDVHDPDGIERAVGGFADLPNGGLIITASALTTRHRELIIRLAARHRLPAVYPFRYFVSSGGLICYGADAIDQYRHAAGYIDRILRGETPADLPVQAPTKFDLVINLRTAKALDLTIPDSLLVQATEVIE